MSCCILFRFFMYRGFYIIIKLLILHASQAERLYRCFNGVKEREADEEARTTSITMEAEAAEGSIGVPGTMSAPAPGQRAPKAKAKAKAAREKTWEQKARAEPCMK